VLRDSWITPGFIHVSFTCRGRPSADDPIPLASCHVHDAKNAFLKRCSNHDDIAKARAVVELHRQRIGEHRCRFRKGNTMLDQIGRGLLRIPLEVAFDDRRHDSLVWLINHMPVNRESIVRLTARAHLRRRASAQAAANRTPDKMPVL
jgi:hypothetical protein